MEMVVNLEILLIILLIVANGLLAMSEIAVVASRKGKLQKLENEGDSKASAALKLANDPNQFLSTVQIGITLVGIFAGAFGGATLSEPLARVFDNFLILRPYSDSISLGVVIILITYFSLVFGELVPKRLALNSPESIAMMVAKPMLWLSKVTGPAVYLLTISTEKVLRLFGLKGAPDEQVSEEEIQMLIQQGAKSGLFEAAEQEMVERVFQLGDRIISSLMTHRSQVAYLDLDLPWEQNEQIIREAPHSFFPVCRGGVDNVVGIAHAKNLFLQSLHNKSLDLNTVISAPVFVPESMPALKVLESFKKTSNHIALVTDEYGVIQGLVTLTDIMEGIVGDIPTEDELSDLNIVQRDDGSWLIDGMLPIQDLKELMDVDELPDEDKGYYQTIGGLVMFILERVPSPADMFEWEGWKFEVVDMDGNRVDKVLLVQNGK